MDIDIDVNMHIDTRCRCRGLVELLNRGDISASSGGHGRHYLPWSGPARI